MRRLPQFVRVAVLVLFAIAIAPVALAIVYCVVDPLSVPMLQARVTGGRADANWVPLDRISPILVRTVVNAEDARYCQHRGVDWDALREVIAQSDEDGPSRGASTLTMQVAKNLFFWPLPAYSRKALELVYAPMLDAIMGKRRVLEIYLNIAEWGEGVYGADAGSRAAFGKNATRLSANEAAAMAAALPAPRLRDPARPVGAHRALAARILSRGATADGLECLDTTTDLRRMN